MIVALAAAIILNGSAYISSASPLLDDGSVAVAVTPALTRIVQRISIDPQTQRIVFADSHHSAEMGLGTRSASIDGRSVQIRFAPFARKGEVYVPLADLVRAFGGTIEWHPRERAIVVTADAGTGIATMPPFDPSAPQVVPHTVFTPEPVVTPRPVVSGSPHPRRTPIPVVPSRPDSGVQRALTGRLP